MSFGGTFDPKKLIVTFRGRPITGWDEGQTLTIEPAAKLWNNRVGVGGETGRSKSNNRNATVTLRLMQTSSDNDFLSLCLKLDEQANAGMGELYIRDLMGSSEYKSLIAYVDGRPAANYGGELSPGEWTIYATDMEYNKGGNII